MINIYGKGGHAKMIASLFKETYSFFYNDDDYKNANDLPWVVAIGDNKARKKVAENNLKDADFATINLGLYVAAEYIGVGVQIAPGAVIQNGVIIKDHTIINTSASIDHDCIIGDYCHIAPNTTLCGAVEVGEGTLIGAGSVILPYVKIGKNCIIGAGSVVTKNIPDNSKAFGNPAKIK